MHELGIVFYIIDDVRGVAEENGVSRVTREILELGEVSGVVPAYLQDAWKWACAREALMDGCELAVEAIPAVTLCDDCGAEYATVEYGRTCPACGSGNTHLLRGTEVMIKEIEVE